MKIDCAWCDKPIAVTCEHCLQPLTPADYPGSTYSDTGTPEKGSYVCLSGQSPIIYSAFAVERMHTSHGICHECMQLTPDERDALARKKLARHQQKKRGPTGVPRSATRRLDGDREKS